MISSTEALARALHAVTPSPIKVTWANADPSTHRTFRYQASQMIKALSYLPQHGYVGEIHPVETVDTFDTN